MKATRILFWTLAVLVGLRGVSRLSAQAPLYPPVGPEPGAPQLYVPPPRGVASLPGVPRVVVLPPWTPNPTPHAGGIVISGPFGPQTQEPPRSEHCVPVPRIEKKIKIEYGVATIDYCLPRCGHAHSAEVSCDCGRPRRKHFLLKREVVQEKPTTDCYPVPACPGGACPDQVSGKGPDCVQAPAPGGISPAVPPGAMQAAQTPAYPPAAPSIAPAPGTPLLSAPGR
jgi:hypothetical protein